MIIELQFTVFGFFGALASILLIVLFGTVGLEEIILSDSVSAATTSNVAVTAEVTVSISCDSSPGSTAFGTLSSTAISTASPNASTTMACANSGTGCVLYVKDANAGLATDTPSHTIHSPNAAANASTTLAAGTEGYGIQATSTAAGGSGNLLPVELRYAVTDNDVGGLVVGSETQALASANSTTTGREVLITHIAAISDATPGALYEDTITYSCLVQ